jgi:methionyl-tRNA formyltransferase
MINIYLIGEKGYVSLKSLEKCFYRFIDTVIVGKDSNVINDFSFQTIEFCKSNNLNYLVQNKTVANSSAIYSIAIGWRWLIRDDSKLIVLHDSLLPKMRGFNPLVTALINGDSEIGISAIFGTEDFDRGDIILQKKNQIEYPIKIKTAIERISILYGNAMNELFLLIQHNNLKSTAQDESLATYSLWRDNEDYKIDWNKDSEYISRFIDAVGYPYNGAYTTLNNSKVFIKDSFVSEDVIIENRNPGKVLFKKNNQLYIVCGRGLLCVEDLYDIDGNKIQITNFRLRFT